VSRLSDRQRMLVLELLLREYLTKVRLTHDPAGQDLKDLIRMFEGVDTVITSSRKRLTEGGPV
jgi:hypothetical protein